jgi:DNA polymerase
MTTTDEPDPLDEAIEFVRAARTFVEWHEAAGTTGFPRATRQGAAAETPRTAPSAVAHVAPRAPASEPGPPGPGLPQVAPAPERYRNVEAPADAPSGSPPMAALPAPSVPLSAESRRDKLRIVQEHVVDCTACDLHRHRTQTVFSRGSPMAELCFVGEGPGADEDRLGEPFVGKAGQLLDKMIQAMGLGPDEVYICNVVKCRPPDNRTPEPTEMATCLPFLQQQLAIVEPKVIVALGGTALRGLVGPTEGITKARGTWRLFRGSIPLMPTFHPAYVLRQPTREVKAMVWSDLQQALKQLGRPISARGGT